MKLRFLYLSLCLMPLTFSCTKPDNSQPIPTPAPPPSPVRPPVSQLSVSPSPGDLSSIEHLTKSDDYEVFVKKTGDPDATYQASFVYKTDNYFKTNPWNIAPRPQESASFVGFSFKDISVDVKIVCKTKTLTSVLLRPLNFSADYTTPTTVDKVITFTMKVPRKLSVEINDTKNPLFLFADVPGTPNPSATYYYGPGVHKIGVYKSISANQSVYIAAGAVVEGSFKIPFGANNVKIEGRGVLTNGNRKDPTSLDYTPMQGFSAIQGKSTNNTLIEGIIITNTTGWTLQMEDYEGNNRNNLYKNLKIVNWNISSDGIWFDGVDNVVDDCFIFNNDDLLTTHGSQRCLIKNTTLWGGRWGNMFMHASFKSSSDITYDNVNVIGKDGGNSLVEVQNGNGSDVTVNNFTMKNTRIEARSATTKWLYIRPKTQKLTNWLFENITLDTKNTNEGEITGTANSPITGMTFRNVKMAGQPTTSLATANVSSNSFVTGITFP